MRRHACLGALLLAVVLACGKTESPSAPSSSVPAADSGPEPVDSGTPTPVVDATIPGVDAYAIRTVHLGEADRNGTKLPDAWKAYGRNIDGIVSTNVANGECMLVEGAPQSMRTDGNDGYDNAWGKVVMKIFDPFFPTGSKSASEFIEAGGPTPAVVVGRKGGAVTAAYTVSEKTLLPSWDGTDVRQLAEAWTDGKMASAVFPSPTIVDEVFDSGELSGTTMLGLPGFDGEPILVPMSKLRIRMKLAAGGNNATEGVISGVLATKELEEAIAKMAQAMSPDLCEGSTIESIKQSIRQASDILKDGTQDPSKDCDGISIGIGFEAVRVTLAGVAPKGSPSPDPCP
jgi:hypothetical protein